MIDSPTWSRLPSQAGSATDFTAAAQNQNIVRQAPSLTGRLQLNEQTLIPFIGAGFGGGYTTDRDRALGSNLQQQILSGDSLGRNMMPNEVNMGFRIPF